MKMQILSTILAAAVAVSLCGCAGSTQTETAQTETAQSETADILTSAKTTQYFTDEAVKDEDVQKILEAGVNAPSGMNNQPWHFTAVTDKEITTKIADDMSSQMPQAANNSDNTLQKAGIADAPLAIYISCEEDSDFDAGLACQNMSAQAQLLGYGTKIFASPTVVLNGENKSEYDELLDIPESQSVAAVLIVGVPDTTIDQSADGVTSASTRNAFDEVVTIK